jgi:hypothetical protein
MSETLIDQATSEDRARKPGSKAVIQLVIAVLSAALTPIPFWVLTVPLWLLFGALSYNAPPGILQKLADTALTMATTVLYTGGPAAFCVGIQFAIFGIPTAILGWRFGRITPISSTIAGSLIGVIPSLLIIPFDQSYDPNYMSTNILILRTAETILANGALGAFEGILFWFVWWFLSRHSVPKKQASGLG